MGCEVVCGCVECSVCVGDVCRECEVGCAHACAGHAGCGCIWGVRLYTGV